MLKKIELLTDIAHHDGSSMKNSIVEAIITSGDNYVSATFDFGFPYTCSVNNNTGDDTCFKIIGDVAEDNSQELDDLRKEVERISSDFTSTCELVSKKNKEIESLTERVKKVSKIKRNPELEGYVILPMSELDQEVAEGFIDCDDYIITAKELTAMYSATVSEIVKGDTSTKSINVKLYNAISGYAVNDIHMLISKGNNA